MLTYSFENLGREPIYEYLYKCIKSDILHHVIPAGTRLPSKRSFASNLNISTITVENAYAQLLAEGYIYSIPKKGYYVCEISPEISNTIKSTSQLQRAVTNPSYFSDFVHTQTNPDNFPFTTWAKLMREIITEKSKELMTNPPCGGIPELREAIAGHLLQFRGMQVSPEQIIIGAGTEYLYGLIIQLLGHNNVFAVEDPGYQKIANIYRCNNVECLHIPLDEEGIDPDLLARPIVSSPRALSVVTKYWMKKYDRKPDFLVAEGPLAGGHLGFKREELDAYTPENYERELTAMIRQAAELEISLIAAGGIYDRRDLEHCLSLGAAGVQMGTRFVTTEECDAADAYKQAYLSARKEDIVIVKSPVGMPGRAIQNAFLEKVAAGERFMTGCRHCIKTCDPKTAPYCITRALINAATGDVDNGLLFCGSNAWRAQKIERTVDIMEEMA